MTSLPTKPAAWAVLPLGTLLLLVSLAHADDFWKKKPPSHWTAQGALKLLRDSPWAHEEVVLHPPFREEVEVSGGTTIWSEGRRKPEMHPSGPATESYFIVKYLVRWESAAPVAQAFARLKELGQQAAASPLAPPPRLPEDRYVITVMMTRPPRGGPVGFDRRDLFDDLDELKQRTRLVTQRATVAPLAVVRTPVGPIAATHFFFPRTHNGEPLLRPQREVEPVEFRVKGKMFTLKSKFTLQLNSIH